MEHQHPIPEQGGEFLNQAWFYGAGSTFPEFQPPPAESQPALKRLGPLPFSGGAFPLMGFFASVYELISTQAGAMLEASVDKPRGE